MQYIKDERGNYYFGKHKMLVSYIRGEFIPKKNPIQNKYAPEYYTEYYPGPVGLVVALIDYDGNIRYGWSKANLSRGDRFSRERAFDICVERAFLKNAQPPFEDFELYTSIREALVQIARRAKNYYKHLQASEA